MQAALMRRLVEAGEHGVPMSVLIDEYLAARGLSVDGKHGARANREQLEAADNAERKRVHDLNNTIGKVAEGWRPVEKIDGRYVPQAKVRIDKKGNG